MGNRDRGLMSDPRRACNPPKWPGGRLIRWPSPDRGSPSVRHDARQPVDEGR